MTRASDFIQILATILYIYNLKNPLSESGLSLTSKLYLDLTVIYYKNTMAKGFSNNFSTPTQNVHFIQSHRTRLPESPSLLDSVFKNYVQSMEWNLLRKCRPLVEAVPLHCLLKDNKECQVNRWCRSP